MTISRCFITKIFLLFLLASCSSDDYNSSIPQEESSFISFSTVLNDQLIRSAAIQNSNCSNANPHFVEFILSQNGSPVVGSNIKPFRVEVSKLPLDIDGDGTKEFFTQESSSLELEPGTYVLEYFKVFEENGNELWIAPYKNNSSGFSDYVTNSLPMEIDLQAGVKEYVDVEVLCYEDRFSNQYGYSFFTLEENEVIPFCIFGNFCLEDGRHAEATRYSVSVWNYSGDPENPQGTNLYSDQQNGILITDYEDYSETSAEPLCLALPDTEGIDEYYFEITLLEFNYETDESVIRTGVITDEDVRNLFVNDDSVDYYHFREGNCNLEDSPQLFDETDEEPEIDPNLDTDGDGHPDITDNCPYQYNENQQFGTPDYYGEACFEPCTLFTNPDPAIHRLLISSENRDFRSVQYQTGSAWLFHPEERNQIATVRIEHVDSKVVIDIFMNHATYLDDHLIEVRDDAESEIFCKLVPVELKEEGPGCCGGRDDYDSRVEIEVPEDFTPPYEIRITANRIMDYL